MTEVPDGHGNRRRVEMLPQQHLGKTSEKSLGG